MLVVVVVMVAPGKDGTIIPLYMRVACGCVCGVCVYHVCASWHPGREGPSSMVT